MITINIVARIAYDRNFVLDLIIAIAKLKEQSNHKIKLVFIGEVYDFSIYKNLVRLAILLEVENQVVFTKKNISIHELHQKLIEDNQYSLNFSNKDEVGYSAIDSIRRGWKTIFYNFNGKHPTSDSHYTIFPTGVIELSDFFKSIIENKAAMDKIINEENSMLSEDFTLNDCEQKKLLSWMKVAGNA